VDDDQMGRVNEGQFKKNFVGEGRQGGRKRMRLASSFPNARKRFFLLVNRIKVLVTLEEYLPLAI